MQNHSRTKSSAMLTIDVRMAWRDLRRNKAFSLINIDHSPIIAKGEGDRHSQDHR